MTTAVANGNGNQQLTIRDRLKNPALIAELGKAMPAHCKPERMARVALTAITRTPKLAQCTEASFFECLLSLSQWGLEPDGRRAHLIPYGNKCTLVIDYKGYVELAYRSGVVKNLHADVVRRGDLFIYDRGELKSHVPHFLRLDEEKPAQAGEVFAVYCLAEMAGGVTKCEVMSREDVEKIRKRSKAGNNGPWVTDWDEMAKKTAFRRLSKWLPLSAEIIEAFERDDDRPHELTQVANARVTKIEGLENVLTVPPEDRDEDFNADGEYTGNTVDAKQESTDDNSDLQEAADMDNLQEAIGEAATADAVSEIQERAFNSGRWAKLQLDTIKLWCDNRKGELRKNGKSTGKQQQLVS